MERRKRQRARTGELHRSDAGYAEGGGAAEAQADDTGDGFGAGLPWKLRTAQEEGRRSERRVAKQVGARLHPNSGAGRIKNDFNDGETEYEAKLTARKTFTLNARSLKDSWIAALRQGRTGMVWLIEFPDIVVEVHVKPKRIE